MLPEGVEVEDGTAVGVLVVVLVGVKVGELVVVGVGVEVAVMMVTVAPV